jgi:phosphatidylglycerol:prolipoprotein diacylglycerol transferase
MTVDFNPFIFQLGPIRVGWYGMMYVLGTIASYLLVRTQIKRKDFGISPVEVDNLYLYLLAGLVIGARLGYVLFYDLKTYLARPSEILAVWHGGMSFHGGLIGMVTASIIFCRKYHKAFWKIADLITVTAPVGLGLGRIGNFINGELYGRATQVPWGMIFPRGGPQPRHPSQLYEFALEGIALFSILCFLKEKRLPTGGILAVFLMFYGGFRFFLEFFREPDVQLGFILGPFTMGQILCALMIAGGAILWIYLRSRKNS